MKKVAIGRAMTMLVSCSSEGVRPERSSDVGIVLSGHDAGDAEGATEGMGADQDENDGHVLDLPSSDTAPPGNEDCVAVRATAELVRLPTDILLVVDNSGSMSFEAIEIQSRLNDFSSQIIASGIDVHVVLVSSYPGEGRGICIDPPLGGGDCPHADDNPPTFTHIDRMVSSHDAWHALESTYDQWDDVMREDAVKHVVVVTDDFSGMGWQQFNAQFQALDPSYAGYVHHSVVCHSNCPSAAGIGSDYITLSMNTGGVASDLCNQDFQAVFDVLATEVVGGSALSCEFEIPPPPDGMEFDPDQVNLEFDDGMGGILPIGRVDSPADCPNVVDGWYYDDPAAPTMIVMCPQTCDKIQLSENGAINIAFGCATVPAG